MTMLVMLALAATLADAPAPQPVKSYCAPTVGGGNQDLAGRLFQQARAAGNVEQRIRLFAESLREFATYQTAYQLGETLMKGRSDYGGARACFLRALELTTTPDAQARAAAQIAETYDAASCASDRINWYKRSLRYYRYPIVEDALRKAAAHQNSDTLVRSGTIRDSLKSCDPASAGASRSFGVEASIDLRIHFAYDRADLTPRGIEQARELGTALSSSSFADREFVLIGHTDSRGEPAYNDDLSLRRADTVRAYLTREFNLPSVRIRVEGRGERELLFSGNTESEHALNRRVEVVVR